MVDFYLGWNRRIIIHWYFNIWLDDQFYSIHLVQDGNQSMENFHSEVWHMISTPYTMLCCQTHWYYFSETISIQIFSLCLDSFSFYKYECIFKYHNMLFHFIYFIFCNFIWVVSVLSCTTCTGDSNFVYNVGRVFMRSFSNK